MTPTGETDSGSAHSVLVDSGSAHSVLAGSGWAHFVEAGSGSAHSAENSFGVPPFADDALTVDVLYSTKSTVLRWDARSQAGGLTIDS